MKKITIILVTCYLLLVTASPTHAVSSGLAISPPVVEILLSPNKKIVQAFTVKNSGENTQFIAQIHSIEPNGDDGHVTLSPTPLDPTSIPLVVKLGNSNIELGKPFTINPNSSQQLVVSLEGASTDISIDTYLALVVSATPPSTINHQPSTTPAISSLVLTTLTPDGTLPVNLEVQDFSPPLFADNSRALSLEANIANLSSIMIRPAGKLELINPNGETVTETDIYPNLVLKQSKRIIQGINEQNEPLPLTLPLNFRNLGPYKIRLTITTPGGSTIQEVERTIWLLPIRASIVTTLLALGYIYLLILLKKRKTPKT